MEDVNQELKVLLNVHCTILKIKKSAGGGGLIGAINTSVCN